MKDRIVIWGQDERDEDILIAIRLLQDSDIIKIWTFPKKETKTEFVDQLFQEWKEGAEDLFPQPHQLIERGISEESMLPESIKTPKTDVIKIAEQEWRVRVLSFRLYQHIKQQIEQLNTRASNLSIFSKDVWAEAKDVSRSIKENTLDRNIKKRQTTELRNSLDAVFDKLKKLQNAEQEKFSEVSKGHLGNFRQKISEVAVQIGKGNTGKKLFDKLIQYQHEVKGLDMTTRDRNALRINFNEAFEVLKANRQSNFGSRMNARVNGLKSAIGKMEASIKRDKDNVSYQSGRINKNNTTQLEYQLRSAKLTLIEDRIHSKEQKLHNMYLTLKDLEKKASKANAKAQKGVLAATTSGKKTPAGDKGKETKTEETKTEQAADKQPKSDEKTQAQATAEVKGEIASKEKTELTETKESKTEEATIDATVVETDVKLTNKEVVEAKAESEISDVAKTAEAEAKSDEKTVTEKEPATDVKPTNEEVVEAKTENVVSDSTKAATVVEEIKETTVASTVTEKEPVAEVKPASKEVVEAKIEETVNNSIDEAVVEEVKKTAEAEKEPAKEVSPANEEMQADESNPISQPVTDAADNLAQKADHTITGIGASVAAAAGALGLAANENPVAESPVSETIPDLSTATGIKEHVEAGIENPASMSGQLADQIIEQKTEDKTDTTKEEE